MKTLLVFGASLLLLAPSGFSKGRKPGSAGPGFDWDDSRVKRGSAANPTNPAFKPPTFEDSLYEGSAATSQPPEPAKREKSEPAKPSKKKPELPAESWTFEEGEAQGSVAPSDTTPPKPAQPLVPPPPDASEPPLPDYPTDEPVLPAPNR